MGLRCRAAAYSHIGGRRNNEDNFFMNGVYMKRELRDQGGRCDAEFMDSTQLYAVCDGMGGAEYGEEASLLAVETLKNYKSLCASPDSSSCLRRLFRQTDREINRIAESHGLHAGDSGTTAAMLILDRRTLRTAHIGDSRIYRLRNGVLERLTKDHSQVQMLIDDGQLTEETAWRHPLKNVITRHLGMRESAGDVSGEISPRSALAVGDRYLICSDGLNDVLKDEAIAAIMSENDSPEASAEALVKRALSAADEMGVVSDNITVVRIDVEQLGERAGAAKRLRRLGALRMLLFAVMAMAAAAMLWIGADVVRYVLR